MTPPPNHFCYDCDKIIGRRDEYRVTKYYGGDRLDETIARHDDCSNPRLKPLSDATEVVD